jgi:Leucine-rich repeat (LRR) protein
VVAALPRLRVLDLRANGVTTLPDELADAPALEKLDLRWNELRALPPPAKALADRGCFVLW